MREDGEQLHLGTDARPSVPPERHGPDPELPGDAHELGHALGDVLRSICGGRLGPIEWFRAAWQHGGAATGFADWTLDTGRTVPAMVKLPVGYREYYWTTMLGAVDAEDWDSPDVCALPTPRVLAGGEELGSYDLAWLIVERLQGPPLSRDPSKPGLTGMYAAAAAMHAACARIRPVHVASTGTVRDDWHTQVVRARSSVADNDIPDRRAWIDVLRRTERVLPTVLARWSARPIDTWCHGDLHGGNVLRREPGGSVVLIDLALVHPGCWVEDALYTERLCWAVKDRLCGVRPVGALARARRKLGLAVDDGYNELADLRRLLMAATAPAFMRTEGHPAHLAACLEVADRVLKGL